MVHSSFSFTSLGEKVFQHGQFSSLYIDHSTSCKTVFNFVRENIFVNWWEKGWIKPNNSHVGFHRFIGRERRFLNPQQSAMINIITVTKLLPIIDTCTVWSGIYNYDKITRIPGLIPKQCISYIYILYATVACWRLLYNPPPPWINFSWFDDRVMYVRSRCVPLSMNETNDGNKRLYVTHRKHGLILNWGGGWMQHSAPAFHIMCSLLVWMESNYLQP